MRVSDDGRGFVLDEAYWGLKNMRDRAAQIRAQWKITTAEGHGTEIEVCIPRLWRHSRKFSCSRTRNSSVSTLESSRCTRVLILLLISMPAAAATNWKLVWSDEFNGAAHMPPDRSRWTYDLGDGGWGNRELEIYTGKPENVSQDGEGHLLIRAIKSRSGKYTSARIKTETKFTVQYGKIAARMKIPYGQGLWPAFWMLGADCDSTGWPACGEIDVMENIGKERSIVHGTIHGPGYSGSKGITHEYLLPAGARLSDDFHIYAVEWSPAAITFLLDDKSYFTVEPADLPTGARWVYNHPFFLLLNLAVGGYWPGNPDSTTQFPQILLVDWVRVWKPE